MAEEHSFPLLENVIFLKDSNLFSSMRSCELRALAAIIEKQDFESGANIVKENDVGDSLYILKNGNVRIVKDIGNHKEIELARLVPGECFGEMAIFDAELRSATVIADGNCSLLCIKSDDLHDLLYDFPSLAIEFLKIFVRRLRKANIALRELSKES